MKKTLFSVAFLISAYFSANAQQNISFETTEGYSAAALHGQNGWTVDEPEEGSTGQNAIVISTQQHSAGAQSLKFVADEEDNALYYDAYKTITTTGNTFSITQDVYVDGFDEENGSDFYVVTSDVQGTEILPVSVLKFDYQGGIEILSSYDITEDEYDFEDVATFENNTWYEVKTTFDIAARTVSYYINNQLVGAGSFINNAAEVNAVAYSFDAYITSFFVDNINVTAGTTGVAKHLTSKFSVSPNPATGIVNINNTANALINNATLTDLNGRTVKTAQFAEVASAQINIADLAAGVYMLNISSDKGTTTKKIVKN